MMPVFYRAFFRCGDDYTSNLTVDLLLDNRRHWVDRVPTGGWWGRVVGDDFWPLILKQGGSIDFGNTTGEPMSNSERYGSIDLADRIVAVNENYAFHYGDRHINFTLEKLTDIAFL